MAPKAKVDTVTDALRTRILEGEYGTAGRLPSLRLLAAQFATTHETMNKAVQRLQAEGLLISYGRAGVFVGRPRLRVGGIATRLEPHLQELGLTPLESNLEEPALVPASADVAKVLGVAEATDVVRRLRLQGAADTPYRLVESFYPVSLAGAAIFEAMKRDAGFAVWEAIKQTHGKAVAWIHEDALARLPTTQEQTRLRINRHTPVLQVVRMYFAKDFARDDEQASWQALGVEWIVGVATFFVLSYDYTVKEDKA